MLASGQSVEKNKSLLCTVPETKRVAFPSFEGYTAGCDKGVGFPRLDSSAGTPHV